MSNGGLNGRPAVDWDWDTITCYLDRFDGCVRVNIAMLVPHGTIRLAVMGMENRAPSSDEMNQPSYVWSIKGCVRGPSACLPA